jgi:DNA/RNA endonuclease G (NUC1)
MKKLLTTILLISTIWLQAQHTITVKHTYYTLQYDTLLKSPLISWYIQTTAHATSKNKIDRKTVADFHQDPLIDSKYQLANNEAYIEWNSSHPNNTRDKGHLSPFSAFDFGLTAAKESMYYTNTAPQYSFFNRHPWEKLEQYVLKTLAPDFDSIYVYTGCLYGSSKMCDVPQPDYYWKVIEYKNSEECWLGPNIETTSTDYHAYRTDIDKLKAKILSYYPDIKLPF